MIRIKRLEKIQNDAKSALDINFLKSLDPEGVAQSLKFLEFSQAQLHQDLFVLSELGFKRGGFFVEFGATNGLELSNSFLPEDKFEWYGILAEPAKKWHKALKNNRPNTKIETDCVWRATGEILTKHSYVRKLENFSQFDDWYVLP